MPVFYEIDRERSLIRTRCVGDIRFEEVVQHFRDLESEPRLPERLDVLLDLTETDTTPETDQLSSLAREVEQLRGKIAWGRCAIVASSDLLFGMSRVFRAFSEAQFAESSVFRTLDEAEHWLARGP